jgi:hypothetical protein
MPVYGLPKASKKPQMVTIILETRNWQRRADGLSPVSERSYWSNK